MSSTNSSFGNAAYQLCQRCGKPLGPNEVQCTNCGFINAPPAAPSPSGPSWANAVPPSPAPSGQLPSGQQWGQSPVQSAPVKPVKSQFAPQLPFGPPNSLFGAPSQSPAPQGVAQQPFAPPSQSLSSPPSFGGFQPATGGLNAFPAAGTQPPSQPLAAPPTFGGFQPGTQAPSQQLAPQSPAMSWPVGTGSLGGFQQPSPNGFQQPGFNSMSTAQFPMGAAPSGTLNGSYNEQEESDARQRPKTGLIIGIVALIVVVLAASLGGGFLYLKARTPVVQATPTPTPLPAPTGKLIFSDSFMNNNNGWDLTSKVGQFSVKVGNGAMALEDDNNRLLWELIPNNQNFSDFYLTVDSNLTKGTQDNGYGLYIRGTSDQNLDIATYYRFEIYGDGSYAIFKGTVDATGATKSQTLVNYTPTTIINKAGKVNHIAISAKGATMTLYVNGQKLKTIVDNTYASGSIALFISNLPQSPPGAAVTFSNLVIYPPQPWA
jgi:hypothetical protein